jgi:hypothetical protein
MLKFELQGKEQLDSEGSSPLTVTSRVCMLLLLLCYATFCVYFQLGDSEIHKVSILQVLYMLGDITAGPALMFTQWLQSVRKRASNHRSSGFPRSSSTITPFWFHTLSTLFIFSISVFNCYALSM